MGSKRLEKAEGKRSKDDLPAGVAERPLLSQHLFKNLFDGSPGGVLVIDRQGTIILANEQAERMFRVSLGRLSNAQIADFFPDLLERGSSHRKEIAFAVPLGAVSTLRGGKAKEGNAYFNVVIKETRVEDMACHAVYFTFVADAGKIEDVLLKSRERYRLFVDTQSEPSCRLLPDTTLIFVNRHFADLFNAPPQDLVGRTLAKLSNPSLQEILTELLDALKGGQPVAELEWEDCADQSDSRWILWRAYGRHTPEGDVLDAQVIGSDITTFKKREQVLRDQEAQLIRLLSDIDLSRHQLEEQAEHLAMLAESTYLEKEEIDKELTHEAHERRITVDQLRLAQKVFENTSEAIVITDADRNVIDINEAYTHITGYKRIEVIGRPAGGAKSGRHDADFYKEMWQTIATSGKWSGEIWDRHKSGNIFPTKLSINAITGADGEVTNYIGVFSDITHLKDAEDKLKQLAYFDPLTGLPNRTLFHDHLERELEQAKRDRRRLAVLFFDLDRFKTINDTLGHVVGDELLVQTAKRITRVLRPTDELARLGDESAEPLSEMARFGGDEFTVVVSDLERPDQASLVGQRIIDALSQPVTALGHELTSTASIGIAIYPEDGEDADTLIKNADIAMYRAKELGRGQYQFFKPELDRLSHEKLQLEQDLRKALEREEFVLFYQPKVDANSLTTVGMEALVRWRKKDGSMVPPVDFIPLTEETGLIVPIGRWILETACRQNKIWVDGGRPLRVAVNLSARQFNQPDLIEMVERALTESGLPSKYLELEVTESMVLGDVEATMRTLDSLRLLGVHVSIDDFGTGYSSLSLLKRLPLDAMKVDQSFVRDMTVDPNDDAIVSAIIAMGRKLGLKIVAEGVETKEQLIFLSQRGCDLIQGYYFSKPLPAEEFGDFPIELDTEKYLGN